jgi:serine/threonine protein kinase
MTQASEIRDIDQIGFLLDGRYRLDEYIGAGPLHRAYIATDTSDDSKVCLKIPRSKFRQNDGFATRYRRDLLDAMKLKDRSWVVPILLAEHETIPFQVLHLLKGKPLPDWFEAVERNEQRLLLVLVRVIKALGRLHRMADRIHGTVKPNNLFVTDQDEPLLLDLAATGRLEDHFAEKAQNGRPIYCSPEQLSGERADPCSDLYSLGLVLYQALTGQHPYFGSTKEKDEQPSPERLLKSLLSQLQHLPCPPSKLAPNVPLWTDRFLARCLHPNPQNRFSDHQEALSWLQHHTKQEQDVSADQRTLPPAGREQEMSFFQEHLTRLKEELDGGCVIRLHGPLGSGKTRCQDWLLDQAEANGMKVLIVEPTPESGLHLQSVMAELTRCWPELVRDSQPVVESLLHIASEEPTLLVIRDVQQADETLVEFLKELDSVVADVPLMLLLIDEETDYASSEVEAFVEGVEKTLRLEPLDKRAIANLIEEKCWTVPATSVSSWVHKVSGGNALHATLLVGYLRDNDFLSERVELEWSTTPPTERPTLEESLIWKLGGLSILGRTILETAAVLGNPFLLTTLNAITYRSAEELDEALGEAVGKGLLELVTYDQNISYRWKHSKFRQTLLKGIHRRRRQRIHRLTAAFYAQGDSDPAKVAHHFLEAGDTREVFYWGSLAARIAYQNGRRGDCSFWLHSLLTRVPQEEWLGPDVETARAKVSRDQSEAIDLALWGRWFRSLSGHPPEEGETEDPLLEAQSALHSGLLWDSWKTQTIALAKRLAKTESRDEPSSRAMILLELEWKSRAPNGEPFPSLGD